jgi:hypothetical protein
MLKKSYCFFIFPASYNLVPISNFTATSSFLMLLIFIARNSKKDGRSRDIIFSFYFLFDSEPSHSIKNYTEVLANLVINLATTKYFFA